MSQHLKASQLCRELGEKHSRQRGSQCKGPEAVWEEANGEFRRQWTDREWPSGSNQGKDARCFGSECGGSHRRVPSKGGT